MSVKPTYNDRIAGPRARGLTETVLADVHSASVTGLLEGLSPALQPYGDAKDRLWGGSRRKHALVSSFGPRIEGRSSLRRDPDRQLEPGRPPLVRNTTPKPTAWQVRFIA